MAEVKNGEEPSLPTKRTPDLGTQEEDTHGPKKQKLQDNNNGADAPEPQNPIDKEKLVEEEEEREKKKQQEEEDEEEEDDSNGEAVIDRKGKGILIEEDDDDDDDDSDSGSGSGSDNLSDDSDFADDPLAEVDLDNILPSRTRRRPAQPGSYIANDLPDEDSDESDDPDA